MEIICQSLLRLSWAELWACKTTWTYNCKNVHVVLTEDSRGFWTLGWFFSLDVCCKRDTFSIMAYSTMNTIVVHVNATLEIKLHGKGSATAFIQCMHTHNIMWQLQLETKRYSYPFLTTFFRVCTIVTSLMNILESSNLNVNNYNLSTKCLPICSQ